LYLFCSLFCFQIQGLERGERAAFHRLTRGNRTACSLPCGRLILNRTADVAAAQQCTEADALFINITDAAPNSTGTFSFPNLTSVWLDLVITTVQRTTLTILFPALRTINSTIGLGGPYCNGTISASFTAPAVYIGLNINVFVPVACRVSSLQIPNLRSLGPSRARMNVLQTLVWGALDEITLGNTSLVITGGLSQVMLFGSSLGSITINGVTHMAGGYTALLGCSSGTVSLSTAPFNRINLVGLRAKLHKRVDDPFGIDLVWNAWIGDLAASEIPYPVRQITTLDSYVRLNGVASIQSLDISPGEITIVINNQTLETVTQLTQCNNSGLYDQATGLCSNWGCSPCSCESLGL
jgi:hypothetical protein